MATASNGSSTPSRARELRVIVVVMGVTGCGKSSIGRRLAARLNCEFRDGDDFHPESNVEKMSSGQPLNDRDREPWLKAINASMRE